MTPQKLGRYEVLGELGKGAMGVVYLARDPIIGRKLALKTFRLAYSAQDAELEQFRVRFLREAQSAGILNHPNVVTIHDVVEDQEAGAIFIAMEYVKGTDLKQLMQRHDKLPLAFVIDVVAQIAEGLDYAHRQGVVHRDVKPANIIITADKKAKITDFGIARVNASNLTVEGQLLGTPNYMAPEQVLAQEVDHRADIFSLGVMLYEMLTGQKPFAGENLTVVTNRIVNDAFTPPSELVPGLPAPLTAILGRALQKRPADRYASAADMAADLRALLKPKEGAPAPPRSTSFLTPLEPQPAAPPPAAATAGGTVVQPAVARPDSGTVAALTPPEGGTVATPADRTTGTFVQPPPAAAQPPADAAAAGRRISPLRLAAIVVLTAVAASAAIGLGYLLVPEVDDPQGLSPEAELQRQWVPLYREGKRLLAEGRPAAAIEAFDQALAIVPENRTVRQARDEADRALLAGGDEAAQDALASRLQAAREALAGRRYQSALDLAVQVLEADPRQREAQRIKRQAEDGLARRDQARNRFRPAPPRSAPPPPAASTPPAAPAAARGTLRIDFFSELPEGVLTVYAGPEQIYQQPFSFFDKGLFRDTPKPGRLEAERGVPAGPLDLRIYLYRQHKDTRIVQLKGDMPAGGNRILRIRANSAGKLEAAIE